MNHAASNNQIRSMSFYVTFSISGTNKFWVATKTIEGDPLRVGLELGEQGFVLTSSRRASYDPAKDGYKLLWSRLCKVKEPNLPYRDPRVVERRFKELQGMGWRIEQDRGQR